MSKKRKNLPLVHFEIDAVYSLESVWVHLEEILDLQVIVFELQRRNLWRHAIVVLRSEIFKLERIRNRLLTCYGESQ